MESSLTRIISFREIGLLFVLLLMLFVSLSFAQSVSMARAPFASSELRYSENSPSGIRVVPASCPSDPHQTGDCRTGCNPHTWCDGTTLKRQDAACTITTVQVNAPQCTGGGGGCNGTCVCPAGQTYQNGQCVEPCISRTLPSGALECTGDCPAGLIFVDNQCVGCPVGYKMQNGQCVVSDIGGTCSDRFFCSGDNLMHRTNTCSDLFVQTCTSGCLGGACLPPPSPTATIRAQPNLVRSGDVSTVIWFSNNTTSCHVNGNNGDGGADGWPGTSGTHGTAKITQQTIYTLTCRGIDSSTITVQAIINIIPNFEETCPPLYHHENGICIHD